MFFHHAFVVVVGDDRKTFGKKIVVGVACLDFDNLTGLSNMLHVLDEHQLDASIGTFGQAWELRCSFFASGFGWSCHDETRGSGC
jgi:hypothetical protein